MRNVGKKEKKFKYTYEHIAYLTKLSTSTVGQYARKGKFNPYSLESTLEFVIKYRNVASKETTKDK